MPRPSPHRTLRYRPAVVLAAALLATTGLATAASAGTVSPHAARSHPVHIQAGGAAAALRAASHAAATARVTPTATQSLCPDANMAPFGKNVCVFTPSMSQTDIQSDLDAIANQQVPVGSQFDSNRYAIYFEPGTYGSADNPLVFQVGYYTEVAGLGLMPGDTTVNGAIDVFNNLCTAGTSNCNSDDNFWRSLSNLTLNVDLPTSPPNYQPPVQDPYGTGCTNSAEIWSASQASPIRRVAINGDVVLQDYCAADNYASGGFIADSSISGDLDFYGNQQYMVRNSDIGGANGCPDGLWNMTYSGVVGAPSQVFTGQCEQNTVLATSPVTEEEPFLYLNDSGKFEVFVPAVQTSTSDTSWGSGTEAGTSIPLYRFLVAYPTTSVSAMNTALAKGKSLLLTPGVYNTSQAIDVSKADTVVLGQGFATLVPQQGNEAITVESAKGVKMSGLIVDAGPVNSPDLVQLENRGNGAGDPDLVQDVFFRVGGAETTATHASVSLADGANHSIIDDVWAWRADHGNDVGWTDNTGATGLRVTGNQVTAYGLAVEHYQKDEVIWTGQGGTDVFFQNELPYDPPSQSAWMASPTQDGYPAFDVGQKVTSFQGYGMGSYVVFIDTTATLDDAEAFEAPDNPNVQFTDVFGVWIAGSGGDDTIIDGAGGPDNSTTPGNQNPVDVTSYPGS